MMFDFHPEAEAEFLEAIEYYESCLPGLGVRLIRSRPPVKAHDPPLHQYAAGDMGQAIPDNVTYGDPDYPWDAYITS